MKEEITVYWACTDFGFVAPAIDNAYRDLHSRIKSMDGTNPHISNDVRLCPSSNNYIKNTFRVKSPIDYNITWSGNRFSSSSKDLEFFERFVLQRDTSAGFVTLSFANYIFFTEEPSLLMEVKNSIYANNSFNNNTTLVEGSMDIGKWYRNTDLTFFINNSNTTVDIKRGDPLFYVKFITDKKIKMQKFDFNPELRYIKDEIFHNRILISESYKDIKLLDKLEMYYNTFRESQYKSRIIKLIKNNLLEKETNELTENEDRP